MNRAFVIFMVGILGVGWWAPVCMAGQNIDIGIAKRVQQAVGRTKTKILADAAEHESEQTKESVALAQQAYQLLLQNRLQDARDKTADALARMTSVSSPESKSGLLPVDVVVQTVSGLESVGKVRDAQKKSLKDIAHGQIQEARALLIPLVDEIDVQHLQLRVSQYIAFLHKASAALARGDRQDALTDLNGAVSQLSIKVVVIPIPLIKAKELVKLAATMADADAAKSVRLLKEANSYLQLSGLLGYTGAVYTSSSMGADQQKAGRYTASVQRLDDEILKEGRPLLSMVGKEKNGNDAAMKNELDKIVQRLRPVPVGRFPGGHLSRKR